MASEKAWYWLAAGVLALGLNGAYQDGQFAWAHRLADRSCSLLERVSERGDRLVAMGEILLGDEPSAIARLQDRLARLQEKVSASQSDRLERRLEIVQGKVARAQSKAYVFQKHQDCSQGFPVVVRVPSIPTAKVYDFVPSMNVRSVQIPEVSIPEVSIPEVRIPEVRIPQIHVPRVRVPEVRVPPVHVQVDDGDSDGLI